MKPSDKKNDLESGFSYFNAGKIEKLIHIVSHIAPKTRAFLTPTLYIIEGENMQPNPSVQYSKASEKKPSWS